MMEALGRPVWIYLDLNHWIGLTKARVGHLDGLAYVQLLEDLTAKVADRSVQVLLSTAH